jgi:Pyridoxamine 5'-phosphate oxidase
VTVADRSDHTNEDALASIARQIIDSNLYMTLATADDAGTPWVSPVYDQQLGERLSHAIASGSSLG